MAEGVLQGRDEGEFDLDLFFFGTEASSAQLQQDVESCAMRSSRGPGAGILSDSRALSSSQLPPVPAMNTDLSSCFSRDAAWAVCDSANIPMDKAGQGDRSPSDITSIIAHLRSLATETSNDCNRTEDPESKSSLAKEVPEPATRTDSRDPMDTQTGGFIAEVTANQQLFVKVDSTMKKKSNSTIYVCAECGKTSPCHSAYLRHQRIHTGEKPYTCPSCGKSFIQISDYNNHIRSHTGEKPYTCAECGKSFSRSTYLVTHSRTHTKEKPYSCNVCGKSFVQHSHLSLHLRIHSGEKPYICIECGNSFSRSSTLVKHKKSHRRKMLHICQKSEEILCNFTQNNPPTWGDNPDQEEPDEAPAAEEPLQVKAEANEVLKCCTQALNYKRRHRGGKKASRKPTRVMLQKYLTNPSERKKTTRKKRSQPVRPESQDGMCRGDTEETSSPKRESAPAEDEVSLGGRVWSSEQATSENLEPHSQDYKIPKPEVANCVSPVPHLDLVYEERSAPGPGEQPHKGSPFICSYCGKSCPCKSAFLRHQRIHTGEKPYSCPTCGKSFIQASDYNNHVRSHTGEKPYTCSWCGKSFSRSTYLVTHCRTHTKEKPYSCNECGKSFIQHSHLAIHLRIHSGEKPYGCQECGKRFSRSSTLIKHHKSHYKTNLAGELARMPETQSPGFSEPGSGGSS